MCYWSLIYLCLVHLDASYAYSYSTAGVQEASHHVVTGPKTSRLSLFKSWFGAGLAKFFSVLTLGPGEAPYCDHYSSNYSTPRNASSRSRVCMAHCDISDSDPTVLSRGTTVTRGECLRGKKRGISNTGNTKECFS